MRITLSMACWGRPERTIRAIKCISNQTINGWEALVVGDGCRIMQEFIDRGEFQELIKIAENNGNRLSITNLPQNTGGHGYHIHNTNIQEATGKYFVLYANDDVILPNHFDNYLSAIENTDYDFMYFNSYVEPYKSIRDAQLSYAHIGHSELIVKTEYARKMPPHTPEYGHDWIFIQNLMNGGGTWAKAVDKEPTYIVKSVPVNREVGID